MNEHIELLKQFSSEKFQKFLNSRKFKLINESDVSYIYDSSWSSGAISSNIATHLLDAYGNLRLRPDLAFNSLWAATNSLYKEMKIASLGASDWTGNAVKIDDSKCIDHALDLGFEFIEKNGKKDDVLRFFKCFHEKVPNFFANQFLYSYANASLSRKQYRCSGMFNSLKKENSKIYRLISETFGKSFVQYVHLDANRELQVNISDQADAHRVVRSLSRTMLDLFRGKEVLFSSTDNSISEKFKFSERELFEFIFLRVIYAARNHSVHGQATSRMLSENHNSSYYRSSLYIYFLNYLYFSVFMCTAGKCGVVNIDQALKNERFFDGVYFR